MAQAQQSIVLASVLVVACSLTSGATAATLIVNGDPVNNRTFTVTGFGSSTAISDLASISINVQATAPLASQARQQASTIINSIADQLAEKYDESQNITLTTTSLNVYAQYGYNQTSYESYITGYSFYISLSITIRNVTPDVLAGVIDAVVNAGNPGASGQTSVNNIEFGLSTPMRGALFRSSRRSAALDAFYTAQEYAAILGLTLGDLQTLDETTSYSNTAGSFADLSTSYETSGPSSLNGTSPISVTAQAVTVTVSATYAVSGSPSQPPGTLP